MSEPHEPSQRRRVTEVWRVELTRALRFLADGDAEQAEVHLTRAHRSAPDRPEVCFALGRERLRQGRSDDGEALLRAAWAGRMPAAAAALARCVASGGSRRAEAHVILDDALAEHGDEPGLLVVRAELHLDEERREAAQAALERARSVLDADGRHAPATRAAITAALAKCTNLEGIELARAGQRESALFAFKRSFDLEPRWSSPLVNMGVVFAELGRVARARACYERAVVLDPGNGIAWHNLGLLARDRGDVATAERAFRRALELDGTSRPIRLGLAELLCVRGDASAAFALLEAELGDLIDESMSEGSLRRLLEADPEDPTARCRLARLLAERGEYAEAAAQLRRVPVLATRLS